MIFVLLIGLSVQLTNPLINSYGHIGGFFIGFLSLSIISKSLQDGDGAVCPFKVWFIISLILEIFILIGGFIILYLKN